MARQGFYFEMVERQKQRLQMTGELAEQGV